MYRQCQEDSLEFFLLIYIASSLLFAPYDYIVILIRLEKSMGYFLLKPPFEVLERRDFHADLQFPNSRKYICWTFRVVVRFQNR